VYEIVVREGAPEDVLAYVDGALLVDLWEEHVLPREIRAGWQPLIDAVVSGPAAKWPGTMLPRRPECDFQAEIPNYLYLPSDIARDWDVAPNPSRTTVTVGRRLGDVPRRPR
jgi:hypothetical protein